MNNDSEEQLKKILSEVAHRLKDGQLDVETFVSTHPQYEEEIRSFLDKSTVPNHSEFAHTAIYRQNRTIVPSQNSETVHPIIRYFGDYELLEEIARGGMGVVYRARQISLDRLVAVKMILAGALASDEDVRRFRSEAESAAKLDHTNIVPIYEIGEQNSQHYFSMALIDGNGLDEMINNSPMKPQAAAEIVATTAEAVNYAHTCGVIHRDLKPSNILLDQNDQPKITDFGLAKRADQEGLTTTGDLLGTPGYMAPEQARAQREEITASADIYGLGAILYAALTGRPPFQAAGVIETITQVIERDPVPPRQLNAAVPIDLQVICLKCLQKEPARRYRSAGELAADLKRFLADEPILARPISSYERTRKWIRRRPAIAALIASTVIVAVLGVSGIIWQWRLADLQREEAHEAKSSAEEAHREAEQKSAELAIAQKDAINELHNSDLLRGDMLLQTGRADQAEELYWREYRQSPSQDKRRSEWRLVQLYSRYPKIGQLPITASFLAEGSGLIAAINRNEIYVLDQLTGNLEHSFQSNVGQLFRPAISPDGSRIACGHLGSAEILVWNLNAANEPARIINPSRVAPIIGGVAGNIGWYIGQAALTADERRQSNRFARLYANINPEICFLNNRLLLSATAAGQSVWDIQTGSEVSFDRYYRNAFRQDQTFVGLTAERSSLIRQLDLNGQTLLAQIDLKPGKQPPKALTLQGDQLELVNLPRKQADWDSLEPQMVLPEFAVLSQDGKYLACISRHTPGEILLIDLPRQIVAGRISNLKTTTEITSIRFSPGASHLLVSAEKTFVYRLPDVTHVSTIETEEEIPLPSTAMTPDGKVLYRTAAPDPTSPVAKYEVEPNPVVTLNQRSTSITALGPLQLALEFDPADQKRMTVWRDGTPVKLETPVNLIDSMMRPLSVSDQVFTPDGKLLLVSRRKADSVVRAYSTSDFSRQFDLQVGRRAALGDLAVSPDGACVAVVSAQTPTRGQITLFDLRTRLKIASIPTPLEMSNIRMEFSPGADKLAVMGRLAPRTRIESMESERPSKLLLIDIQRKEIIRERQQTMASQMCFADDDHVAIGFDRTRRVELVALSDFETKATWNIGEAINALAKMGDEPVMACGTAHGNIYLWDIEHHTQLARFRTHSGVDSEERPIGHLRFSEDGQRLRFSAGNFEGQIRFDIGRQRMEMNRAWATRETINR